jgi:hypothetical protein
LRPGDTVYVPNDGLSFPNDLGLPADVAAARHAKDRDRYQQRPQAELKPADFGLRRLGFGRLGFHIRIIRRREQPEREIRADVALFDLCLEQTEIASQPHELDAMTSDCIQDYFSDTRGAIRG